MVMETREQAKSKAQEAQAQNYMEDNKKKIPVLQAKMKLMNAQNKMKADKGSSGRILNHRRFYLQGGSS